MKFIFVLLTLALTTQSFAAQSCQSLFLPELTKVQIQKAIENLHSLKEKALASNSWDSRMSRDEYYKKLNELSKVIPKPEILKMLKAVKKSISATESEKNREETELEREIRKSATPPSLKNTIRIDKELTVASQDLKYISYVEFTGQQRHLVVLESSTGQVISKHKIFSWTDRGSEFSRDNKYLYYLDIVKAESLIISLDLTTKALAKMFKANRDENPLNIRLREDNKKLLIKTYHFDDKSKHYLYEVDVQTKEQKVVFDGKDLVDYAFDPISNNIILVTKSQVLTLSENHEVLKTVSMVSFQDTYVRNYSPIRFSGDAKYIFVEWDNKIIKYRSENLEKIAEFDPRGYSLSHTPISYDGNTILAQFLDRQFIVNFDSGGRIQEIPISSRLSLLSDNTDRIMLERIKDGSYVYTLWEWK